MSKAHTRSRRKRGNVGQRRKAPDSGPVQWTLKERLVILALVLAGLLFMIGPYVILSVKWHRDGLRQRVESWQTEHGLSEAQVREILEVEFEFHGSGNPLWSDPAPTESEMEAHREEIARLLGQDDPTQIRENDAD